MAAKKSKVAAPPARQLRTLQHQTLPPATRHGIDTEVWLRSLVLAAGDARGARWATKDQVYDEALGWFLERHEHSACEHYPARRDGDEDLTFWVDAKIMQRVRRMAARDGIKVARFIDAALTQYVQQRVPVHWLDFRQQVQRRGSKLYADHDSDRGSVRNGRAARARLK